MFNSIHVDKTSLIVNPSDVSTLERVNNILCLFIFINRWQTITMQVAGFNGHYRVTLLVTTDGTCSCLINKRVCFIT